MNSAEVCVHGGRLKCSVRNVTVTKRQTIIQCSSRSTFTLSVRVTVVQSRICLRRSGDRPYQLPIDGRGHNQYE